MVVNHLMAHFLIVDCNQTVWSPKFDTSLYQHLVIALIRFKWMLSISGWSMCMCVPSNCLTINFVYGPYLIRRLWMSKYLVTGNNCWWFRVTLKALTLSLQHNTLDCQSYCGRQIYPEAVPNHIKSQLFKWQIVVIRMLTTRVDILSVDVYILLLSIVFHSPTTNSVTCLPLKIGGQTLLSSTLKVILLS